MSDNEQQGVTIITPTIRMPFIDNLLENYERQQWNTKELIIIVNHNGIDLKQYVQKAADYSNVRVFRVNQRKNLGACLNYGVSLAKYNYIAKFDDDDYYSPYYIPEAMEIFAEKKADVVGKRTTYFFFPHLSKLLLRQSPLPAKSRSTIIAGPTIMFHKRVFNRVTFSKKVHQGTDVRFIRNCLRKGYRVYTSTPYNFASIRREDRHTHTWKVSERQLLSHRRAKIIVTNNFQKHIVRKLSKL